ncbi:MAG: hypothetical protein LN417_06855 [Candidatus Thermoplasmatota archaeon]|nr:hypothetical protein [Candidatus Thermoplasmatota archaeon]
MERRHRSHRYNVSYAGTKGHERGMIFLDMSGTEKRDRLPPPFVWAKVHIEGEEYWGRFVKIALNVVKKEPTESRLVENVLPSILLDWCGREGILPGGKTCHVAIDPIEGKPEEFTLEPCR